MNQDKLYQDFPIAFRCEGKDSVVFVAVPRGARYGDVRKTLGSLIRRPYASIHIGPPTFLNFPRGPWRAQSGAEVTPFDVNQPVAETGYGGIVHAQILVQNSEGVWVAE